MAKLDTSKLNIQGFNKATDQIKPRMIIALDGAEGTGKTEFALTAPNPIGYQSIDIGTEGVIEKWVQRGKDIYLKQYTSPLQGGDMSDEEVLKRLQNMAGAFMDDFLADYKLLLKAQMRTIVWDTASEFWQILRIARFGKLQQVRPHHYGPVNQEYLSMVKMAYDSNTNLILLHKVKNVWVGGDKTEDYERSGMNETGYLVQVDATTYRDEEGFHFHYDKCRSNPELLGVVLDEPMNIFSQVASLAYPETDPDMWES